mgnify:CR=1 FL=1
MVTLTFGETSIPADSYSVRSGGTVQVASAFERSVAIVGGMDTDNGTATEGELVAVSSLDDAADLFGEDSELYTQIEGAFLNGAATIYGAPVAENALDETMSGSESGTLSNAPIFNPNIHPDHTIEVSDDTEGTDMTVDIVYDSPSQPSDTDTVLINPITGEWYADASSDYTFSYTNGDYEGLTNAVADEAPRVTAVCTESESVINAYEAELQNAADDYGFSSGVYGATPFADTDSPDITGFTSPFDSERISTVMSPYGYVDDAETEMVRTVGFVAGEVASLPLGESATANSVNGLTGLRTDLSPNQAGDLIDKGVLPLIDYPGVEIVKDMTTSSDQRFERIYTMNIADEIVTLLHEVNRQYIGEQPRDRTIRNLRRSVKNMLSGLTETEPPLLDTLGETKPYAVEVERSDSDDNVFNERVGVKPAGVIDAIDVSVTLGDVVDITRR